MKNNSIILVKMTSGELNRNGVGEGLARDLAVSPVEQARYALEAGFIGTAVGQGPWATWPESAHVSPTPRLLRLGRVLIEGGHKAGYPFVVPLLGEGHMLIGDPTLTEPIEPSPPKDFKSRRAEEEAVREANQLRLQNFHAQRFTALKIATGLIARAGGMLPTGQLKVSVYEPRTRAYDFSPLAAMNSKDNDEPPHYTANHHLPGLLESLEAEMDERFEVLGEFASLLECAETTGELPVSWHIAVLIGDGKRRLSPPEQEQLDGLMRGGARAGISLIISGFDTKEHVTWLTLPQPEFEIKDGKRVHIAPHWAMPSASPDLSVYLDYVNRPPSRLTLVQSVTHDIPAARTNRQYVSGVAYERMITYRQRRYAEAKRITAHHDSVFPLLNPVFLKEQLAPSAKQYAAIVSEVACSDDPYAVARTAAQEALGEKSAATTTERMMSWATLQLVRSAGESQRRRLSEFSLNMAAGVQIQPHITELAQLVAAIAPSGLAWLKVHPDMEVYVGQSLPDRPPAWMYQVVADVATTSQFSFMPARRAALDVVCYDINQAFDVELGLQYKDNRVLLEALIELRLMNLYDFSESEMPEQVRELLIKRAISRLARIGREQLPPAAHEIFDAYTDYIEAQQAKALGSAATGVAASIEATS